MCMSTDRAQFSGTTVYLGRRHHAEHGLVHVLGYQNTAANLAEGPNAMLLHLPASLAMSRRHFLSARRDDDVLGRMVEALRAPAAGGDGAASMSWMGGEVEVFDHDIYTVLLAADARAVPEALEQVPVHKRPRIDPALMRFYAHHYPAHTLALCCFDNAQAERAAPLLMWYVPADPDELTLPALDCHTGGPPDLDARVPVDHWVVFGTDEAPNGWGEPVRYAHGMRQRLREFLPDRVTGSYFGGRDVLNGDFTLSHDDLLSEALDQVRRVGPPGGSGPGGSGRLRGRAEEFAE
ncbi:hypothetical protein LHJ74_17160 [Streptomyces sp. N2-109]|uniref:Uncharacterized protein n=1 Tax=Streptomyces gossypii TaxID=2883101 RepID=A0ABT2JUR5_9ACTN|nr:hypothetical protein [Streptomyces gossypii]MCT2591605.1 hypothetical protein [Streptomyces gossypii]